VGGTDPDILASVSLDDLIWTVEGVGDLVVDYVHAEAWIRAIRSHATVTQTVLSLVPDRGMVDLALLKSETTIQAVDAAARDLLSVAGGRPWWVVVNIVSVAAASWEHVGGELALRGVRAWEMPLGAWLDAAWATMFSIVAKGAAHDEDPGKLDRWRSDMLRRPSGPAGADDGGMDEAEFDAAMAAMSVL